MPRSSLAVIVLAQFAGTSLWFAGNAVLAGNPQFSTAALTASVQAGFIAGTLLFSLLALADRWPATLVFLGCSLLGAGANACIPFLLNKVSLVFALRGATGFFLAGIYPVGMKIAAERFPLALGKAMGWLVGALVLGTAFPHWLKQPLAQWNPALVFWILSLIAAGGGILLFVLVPASAVSDKAGWAGQTNPTRLQQLNSFYKPALGYLGHMWELYTFWAFVPLLLQAHAGVLPGRPMGLHAFLIIAIGFPGCVAGGILAGKKGSAFVARWALVVSGACCLLLPLALQLPVTGYRVFLAVWGVAVVADSPQLSALAAGNAPPQFKGTALMLLTCAGFSLTIVSLLFIQYLAARLALPCLALMALAPGPLLGAWALWHPRNYHPLQLMLPLQQISESRKGFFFAIAATLLWSGNFIVARGVIHQVPPVTLAFFRWATATLLLLPFAWRQVRADSGLLLRHFRYLSWTALSGITLFNTLVYVAGHHSPAINLALIGTTSAPVFATIMAALFLKEKIGAARLCGMVVCFGGILLLLSKGDWQSLQRFHFGTGDLWVLGGAFSFSIYTIQVRRKPAEIGTLPFLWVVFAMGTLFLLPALVWETRVQPPVRWTPGLAGIVLYLGLGTSVIAFMIWNLAIARLGAARTSLFGNLIPLFSTIEAVLILGEPIQTIHLLSGALILTGLLIANRKGQKQVEFPLTQQKEKEPARQG